MATMGQALLTLWLQQVFDFALVIEPLYYLLGAFPD